MGVYYIHDVYIVWATVILVYFFLSNYRIIRSTTPYKYEHQMTNSPKASQAQSLSSRMTWTLAR